MNKIDLALTQNPQLTGFLIYPAVQPAMLQQRYQTTQTKLENEARFSLPGRAGEEVKLRIPVKMWRCVFNFCVFTAVSLRILLSHLNLVHSDDEFQIICGLGDLSSCHKVYHKYNSFYKHVRRKHDDVYKGHTSPPEHGNYFIVPHDQEIDDGGQNSTDFVEEEAILPKDVSDDMICVNSSVNLDEQLRGHAVLFIER